MSADRVIVGLQVPAVSSLGAAGKWGRVRILSTDGRLYFDNGTIWVPFDGGAAVELDDAETVSIAPTIGRNRFFLETGNSRTLAMAGAGYDMQQIVIRIKNTSGSAVTPVLDTGAANKFRFGSDFTAIPEIAAGKNFYFTAIYNLPDERWDYLGKGEGF